MPPLTMRQLGKKGRFGNQLFQYAHLRIESRGDYQCVPWVGQQLFGLNDPPVTKDATDIGFKFPLDSSYYAPYKEEMRKWFTPTEKPPVSAVIDRFHEDGATLIGIHMRRGDYGTFKRKSARWCFVAPSDWYIAWLRANLGRFKWPVLCIASDDPDAWRDFKGFDIAATQSPERLVCYPDFFMLTQCDVLLISNSTFGFAASMLNTGATEFWRPRLGEKKLIPYDPWNAPLVFKDELY